MTTEVNDIIKIQADQLLEFNKPGYQDLFRHLLEQALQHNYDLTEVHPRLTYEPFNIWRGQNITTEAVSFITKKEN
jgi:hypothetical protein